MSDTQYPILVVTAREESKQQKKKKNVVKGTDSSPAFTKGFFGRSWKHEHFTDRGVLRIQQFVGEFCCFIVIKRIRNMSSLIPVLFMFLNLNKFGGKF